MNKKLFVSLFVFFLCFGFVSAASVSTLTSISGTVKSNGVPVSNASLLYVCDHNNVLYSKLISTDGSGKYFAFVPNLYCSVGDRVFVYGSSNKLFGFGFDFVKYNLSCRLNTVFIDLNLR
jgi:hypothetical protein